MVPGTPDLTALAFDLPHKVHVYAYTSRVHLSTGSQSSAAPVASHRDLPGSDKHHSVKSQRRSQTIEDAVELQDICAIISAFSIARVCLLYVLPVIFTRATPASAGISSRRVSICLSVRPYVTSRCSTETAKRRITQKHHTIGQHSSFLVPKISAKFRRSHPQRRRQMKVGYAKCRCGSCKAKRCQLSSVASLSR